MKNFIQKIQNQDKSQYFMLKKNTKLIHDTSLSEVISIYYEEIKNSHDFKEDIHNQTIIKVEEETLDDESYTLDLGKDIVVKTNGEKGLHHALRTLLSLQALEGKIPYGQYHDYPDVKERRLHLDIGRKYFTKAWLIKLIHRLSYLQMNTLQLHFSKKQRLSYCFKSGTRNSI